MKEMKRILALVLCFVMLVGLVPAAAFEAKAAGNTIYVLAGGDFQEAGDHANSAANVTNILAQVSQKYTTMDGFLFIGDYDCETHDDAAETANGITALMGAVQGSYSNLNDANSVLVQGNHDYMDSRIDATGGHEFEGYAAYVLNEDDYPNGGGSQSGVQTLANNLKTWLNDKIGEGYDAPIFIVSHLPLAFTPRTVTQGDAKYAKYIFDVLNDAGDNGLNIIFLHGHDHAYGPDNYMGGEAIYLPKGDKICIAEAGSTSAWTEETLNFTYMNAGYVGYYSDPMTYVTTAGTDKLTMTVFAITGDEVTVERYSESGLYNLKSAGYDGSYSDTSVTNLSLGLPKYEAVYTSPQTIALTEAEDYGTIGNWVGVSAEVTDDVTTSGNDWTTITEPVGGTTTYAYTQATSITGGNEYVIVANSQAVALMDDDGDMESQTVTISGSTMTSDVLLTEWTFSNSNSGTIYSDDYYFRYNNNSFSLNSSEGYASTVYITDNGENFKLSGSSNTNRGYSLYYTGSAWATSGRNTTEYVRLFVRNEDGDVTTGGTNGLYYKLDGALTYNVAVGTSAEDALAAVKAGIAVKYATAADYSDVAEFADDGEGMSWVLDPNYDPNVPGDYAVTISYNGTVLGIAEVVVPAATTYYFAEGNGLYLVEMNTTEANALAAVKAGVTVYSATDANGTNKTAISDDDVTWNWVDKYNGADSGPYTVEILKDGKSLGTVEVKVNVKYETEINPDWTYIGESEATGGTYYTRVENVSDLVSGEQYLIILDCSSQTNNDAFVIPTIVTTGSGSSQRRGPDVVASNGITDNATITGDYDDYLWTLTQSGNGWKIGNGSQYINVAINNTSDRGELSFTNSGEALTIATGSNNPSDANSYSFAIRDSSSLYWQYNLSATLVYATEGDEYTSRFVFYGREESAVTPGGPIYGKIEGNTVYTVTQGTSATVALNKVKAGITGYISANADGSDATELDDSDLKWTWKNTYASMVTGSYWVEISYQGKVLGTVEVKVQPGVVNNYPEYPNEGAVKVNKTATGVDFQSSGIAQVEVSASGVPVKKGADVIVMLDTSSSMTSHTVTGSSKTRAEVLEESLEEMIAQFKAPGADGELLDLRIAIADFNGFYTSGDYARDSADTMSDDIAYSATSEAQVYTGDRTLGAGAFIDVADLANSYTLNYTSGTNYDYAFDAIYQLGTAIKEANGSEDRDLYVIFMSDGAAMQWNYYHSQGASELWNNWITGAWDADDLTTANLNCTTHAYYYDEVDHNGDGMLNEHRMANAIKGDPNQLYEVIRKADTLGTPTGEANMYMVPGLGATMFSISFDAQTDTNVTEESMDKSIATLASEQTGSTQYYYKVTSAEELSSAFDSIGAEIAYAASNARYVDQMGDNYNLQMAVSNYEVVDGTTTTNETIDPKIEIISYDIYTRQDYLDGTITADKIGDRKGTSTVLETVTFNADGTEAYSDKKSGNILIDGVIHAQTFWYNTTATEKAVEGVSIPTGTKGDGTTTGSTNLLPSETFYWKLGTVQTSELAMRYYVYLEGSMEGTKEGGSYPTNEYATLYYDNYLGNPCKKDTVSPVMAWKEANVSYAFYLVNENGEIIVNQTTGQTGSFANKIAVTNPVVYETVLLNSDEEVSSIDIASLGVLPEGYTLYDVRDNGDGTQTGATYTVVINSNTTGEWEITSVKDVHTTYVTQYDPADASAYSNDLTNSTVGDDYTHTVVWFAVLWKVQALPDTVVIDYGLPVDISVLTNDMFGENGKLAGVGAVTALPEDYDTAAEGRSNLASGFGTNYTGTYGSAKADPTTGKVRYTLNTSNGMQMQTYEKFAYAVNYTGNENAGYYYDTVTVIPATTIYYEDNFVTTESYTWDYDANDWTEVSETSDVWTWTQVGEVNNNATQDEDRPGQYSLTDANNIYGYDDVNLKMSTYSLGSAYKASVDYDNKAHASFTFYGTGFDVISMTNSDTGTILVDVYRVNDDGTQGEAVRNLVVDTYYGYTQADCHVIYTYRNTAAEGETEKYEWVLSEVRHKATADCTCTVADELPAEGTAGQEVTVEENAWIKDTSSTDAIWQVPVMKVDGLEYGKYKAEIQVIYDPGFDHKAGSYEGTYDFYLDAIRIYDPANDGAADGSTDTTIEDAYKADGEGWPTYFELRNGLITADTLGNTATNTPIIGLVCIDGDAEVGDAQITDYASFGPNNEVYLAPGQRVAFLLSDVLGEDGKSIVDNIHIGISSANGETATYTITNIAQASNSETGVNAGDYYGAKTATVNTTTDMYYDLTGWKGDIIVISNTGDKYNTTGIISLTNIKATYTADPGTDRVGTVVEDANSGVSTASEIDQNSGISLLSTSSEIEETVETTPNEVYAYMTPAAATLTLRSLNAPAVDNTPDETVPEETVPETTVPEETEPETTVPEETEPETTVPEETEPETTVPEETRPSVEEVVETIVKEIIKAIGSWFGKWF